MWDGEAKAGFLFNVQKQPVLNLDSTPSPQKPHSDTSFGSYQYDRKSSGRRSGSSADYKKMGGHEDDIADVLQFATLSASFSLLVLFGTLLQFFDQWQSLASNMFVPYTVKDDHLQPRCHPISFCNWKQFDIKLQ